MINDFNNIKRQEAFHYYRLNKLKLANKCFFDVLAEQPNDGEILYYISNCFYQLEDYQESIHFCTQAAANRYDSARCNKMFALVYMEINNYVEAERCFLEVLRSNPNEAGTIAAYSSLMLKTGHSKKAKKLLDEALRLQPDSEEVLHYCYIYFLSKNQQKNLDITLQKYFEIGSNDTNKLYKAGVASYYIGDYKSAKETLRQAFLLEPENKQLYTLLRQVEREGNIALLPIRVLDKFGGPKIFWLVMITSLMILKYIKAYKFATILSTIYIAYAIYTWMVVGILKIIEKRESKSG